MVSPLLSIPHLRLLFLLRTWTGATCGSPSATARRRTVSTNVSMRAISFCRWPAAQLAANLSAAKIMEDVQSKQMCCTVINTLKLTLCHINQRYYTAPAQKQCHRVACQRLQLACEKCRGELICLLGPVSGWMQPVMYVLLFFNILFNFGGVEGRDAWYWQPCHPICLPHGQAIPSSRRSGAG